MQHGRKPLALVIGPSIYYVSHSILEGFDNLGWDCRVVQVPHVDWHWKNRFGPVFGGGFNIKIARQQSFQMAMVKWFIPLAKELTPDLLLIVQPAAVSSEVRDQLQQLRIPIIGWATDSLSHHPGQAALLPIMKRCYFNDGGDARSVKMPWLPLGFDEQVFRPSTEPPLFDVLYVGNMSGKCYRSRWQHLQELRNSDIAREYRVGVIGSSRSWLEAHLKRMPGHAIWVNHYVPLPKLGQLIARSKVVVNIHQDDGVQSVNPIFFAIGGTGVCQVAQGHAYLRAWLRPGLDYHVARSDAFLEDLREVLENEALRKTIANSGLESSKTHTFTERLRHILTEENVIG